MKQIIALLLVIAIAGNLKAQIVRQNTTNSNVWLGYFGDYKFSKKIGLHLEAQWRRTDLLNKPQQLLLRPAINFYFNDYISAALGYGFAETYPYGAFPVKTNFPESRMYEQLQLKQNIKKTEWTSRFRLEQRFSQTPIYDSTVSKYVAGNTIYTNRFRLFERFNFPLDIKTRKTKPFYVYLGNEFFINLGKNVASNYLDQNRLQAGLGYKLSKTTKIELGYLEQTIVKGDAIKIENNHTAILSIVQNTNWYGK